MWRTVGVGRVLGVGHLVSNGARTCMMSETVALGTLSRPDCSSHWSAVAVVRNYTATVMH